MFKLVAVQIKILAHTKFRLRWRRNLLIRVSTYPRLQPMPVLKTDSFSVVRLGPWPAVQGDPCGSNNSRQPQVMQIEMHKMTAAEQFSVVYIVPSLREGRVPQSRRKNVICYVAVKQRSRLRSPACFLRRLHLPQTYQRVHIAHWT
jgi:hypothetical protein